MVIFKQKYDPKIDKPEDLKYLNREKKPLITTKNVLFPFVKIVI